jgi:hypothetical protein
MGSAVSTSNTNYINENWDKIKCSPIAPYLQMMGIAPGNANDTATECKSSDFSSQFNSSMTEHLNVSNQLAGGMSIITNQMNSVRAVLANIQQEAFNDLSMVATKIFDIYKQIGQLMTLIIKHLTNILRINKDLINIGAYSSRLLIALINLISIPINGINDLVRMFSRKKK